MHELNRSIRNEGFGCSELGAVHGVDPFLDLHALYVQKFEGMILPPTKSMEYGKLYEEATLQAFVAETGIKMRPCFNETYRHPEFPKYHLFGSPDGLPEDEEEGGLDCKLAEPGQWKQWGPPDDAVPLIPPRVELQVRGYMEIFKKRRWYIAVYFGGSRILIYTIPRDEEFGAFILNGTERVWQTFEKRERPPIGSNRISTAWLQRAFPRHKRPDIRPATDAEIALLTRYGQVRAQQQPLAKERIELENKLREAVGNREGIESPHATFTWRRSKDSTEVDWKSMAIALRTFYIKDPDPAKQEELRQKVTDDHTRPKPGIRRIRFTSDEVEAEEEEIHAA